MKQEVTSVLIADDHPLFREGLRAMIERGKGFRVTGETGNGREALELAEKLRPDVIILDMDMPGLNGLDAARELRARNPSAKIIFLTMHKEEDLFNEAMSIGALGYVLKESAVPEIARAIESAAREEHFISPALFSLLAKRRSNAASLLRERPGLTALTPGELRILKLIAENMTSKEIADQLSLSVRTVENHRANICAKLDLQGAHSLVKFAFENRARL